VAENLIQDSSWKDNTLWFKQLSEKPKIFLHPLIGMWFIAQSATISGTIFFSRWAYIKTAFTGFILFFSIYLIAGFAFETLVTDLAHKVEINSNAYSQIKPTHDMLNNIIFMALKYVFTPILLLIAYFKLKEKQV
jgi:galactitol-specific phosphotransferase system IIC component